MFKDKFLYLDFSGAHPIRIGGQNFTVAVSPIATGVIGARGDGIQVRNVCQGRARLSCGRHGLRQVRRAYVLRHVLFSHRIHTR